MIINGPELQHSDLNAMTKCGKPIIGNNNCVHRTGVTSDSSARVTRKMAIAAITNNGDQYHDNYNDHGT